MKRTIERMMKVTLFATALFANVCLMGCNAGSESVVEVQEEEGKRTTEVITEQLTEQLTEEVTEEKRDYMSEIQLAVQSEQYEEAEILYKEFFEVENAQEALYGVLNMWILTGNDAKVKEWVQYVKDNCAEPNADLSALITKAENCRWMIANIEGINDDDTWFVEYDEQGRIIHTNMRLHDGMLALYGSDTDYYYEYLEDGRVKQEEGDFSLGPKYFTYEEEDGRPIRCEWQIENGEECVVTEYSYTGEYGYSENGISYSEKQIEYQYGDSTWGYISYSGHKVGVFPITGNYQHQIDYEVDNTFDEYGNLVKRYEQAYNWISDKWTNEGFEIEYVYCTPEEYFVAKENNDFSVYAISSYETYIERIAEE